MVSRIILSFGVLSFLAIPSQANNNLKHIVDLTKNLEQQVDEKVQVMNDVAEFRKAEAARAETGPAPARAPASIAETKPAPSRAPASVVAKPASRMPASVQKPAPSRAPASFGTPRKVESTSY